MKEKERYFAPASEVMELRLEGVIAASEIIDGIPAPDELPGLGF